MKTSLAALVIALISLIATIVLGTKNYRKSKRLEFFQRRDHCFQKISDLHVKISAGRILVARYEVIAMENNSLLIDQRYDERSKDLVARIRAAKNGLELSVDEWTKLAEDFYQECAGFTPKDIDQVERLIAIVQGAFDSTTQANEGSLSALHILESANPIYLASMERIEKRYQQTKLEIEEARRGLQELDMTDETLPRL